jgi:Golgi SNAP receptor complex protein 1
MHTLMQERSSVGAAHSAADRVLLQATHAHGDLESQRQRLGGVQNRLQGLARAVPGLNSLMTRIRGKREKDRLIMAACIGSCVVLISKLSVDLCFFFCCLFLTPVFLSLLQCCIGGICK